MYDFYHGGKEHIFTESEAQGKALKLYHYLNISYTTKEKSKPGSKI